MEDFGAARALPAVPASTIAVARTIRRLPVRKEGTGESRSSTGASSTLLLVGAAETTTTRFEFAWGCLGWAMSDAFEGVVDKTRVSIARVWATCLCLANKVRVPNSPTHSVLTIIG